MYTNRTHYIHSHSKVVLKLVEPGPGRDQLVLALGQILKLSPEEVANAQAHIEAQEQIMAQQSSQTEGWSSFLWK